MVATFFENLLTNFISLLVLLVLVEFLQISRHRTKVERNRDASLVASSLLFMSRVDTKILQFFDLIFNFILQIMQFFNKFMQCFLSPLLVDFPAKSSMDQYERLDEIGAGSFGKIYKIRRRKDGKVYFILN